jgi:hypothetical protein
MVCVRLAKFGGSGITWPVGDMDSAKRWEAMVKPYIPGLLQRAIQCSGDIVTVPTLVEGHYVQLRSPKALGGNASGQCRGQRPNVDAPRRDEGQS